MRYASWPAHVRFVVETLKASNYETYLVGGCVRDTLLGREIHDFDVATNAHPDMVVSLFPRTIPTGLQHGTVTVLCDNHPVEVTTYRCDLDYADGRRPDGVVFTDVIETDLARRDFTMNAIAMDLTGRLVDPHGGKLDIQHGVIRAVGEAQERFREDGLRILRALRFAAQLSFQIAPETEAAMMSEVQRLECVSPERIGQEMVTITRTDWWSIVPLLAEGPFLDFLPSPLPHLRPGFAALMASAQGGVGVQSTWNEITAQKVNPMYSVDGWECAEPALTASVATWIYMADQPAALARSLTKALAWSHQWSSWMQETVEWLYLDPGCFDAERWRFALFDGRPFCLHLACSILDAIGKHPMHNLDRKTQFQHAIRNQPIFSLRDLAVSGHDLMAYGFAGPRIGQVKRVLATAVLQSQVPNQRESLLACAQKEDLQ